MGNTRFPVLRCGPPPELTDFQRCLLFAKSTTVSVSYPKGTLLYLRLFHSTSSITATLSQLNPALAIQTPMFSSLSFGLACISFYFACLSHESRLSPLRTPLHHNPQKGRRCHGKEAQEGVAPPQAHSVDHVLDHGSEDGTHGAAGQIRCRHGGGRMLRVEIHQHRHHHAHTSAHEEACEELHHEGHGEGGAGLQGPAPRDDANRCEDHWVPKYLQPCPLDGKMSKVNTSLAIQRNAYLACYSPVVMIQKSAAANASSR